jgi:hypothetical protein
MSLNPISTSLTSTLQNVVHGRGHGRHKGAHEASTSGTTSTTSTGTSSIGTLPVSVSNSLFGNLVQSFEQTLGSQSSTAAGGVQATSGATGTSAAGSAAANLTPAQQQEAQAFVHSLVQALKQDGLGANGAPVTPSQAEGGSSAAGSSLGGYQGNLATSLQSLIQQLGPGGNSTAATQSLTSSFQSLVSGVSGTAAAGSASSDSTNASLRNLLGNLLQNVQSNGLHTLSLSGSNVDAHV